MISYSAMLSTNDTLRYASYGLAFSLHLVGPVMQISCSPSHPFGGTRTAKRFLLCGVFNKPSNEPPNHIALLPFPLF